MKSTKTKEQIVNSYETSIVLKVISWVLIIGGVVLAIILSGRSTYTLTNIVLAVSFVGVLILTVFAIRCPICDSFRTSEYFVMGVLKFMTGGFRCDECKLSGKQIREYVDLLKRGVDIDETAIARLNKREL